MLQNSNDPTTHPGLVQEYSNCLGLEKEIKWLDQAKDRVAAYDDLGTHPEVLSECCGRLVESRLHAGLAKSVLPGSRGRSVGQ